MLLLAQYEGRFQVNPFAPITFTQPFIAHFRTRRSGHIVSIFTVAAFSPAPSPAACSASKAALSAFGDALGSELKLYGIKVLAVLCGFFGTGIHQKMTDAQQYSAIYTDSVSQGHGAMASAPVCRSQRDVLGIRTSSPATLFSPRARSRTRPGYSCRANARSLH